MAIFEAGVGLFSLTYAGQSCGQNIFNIADLMVPGWTKLVPGRITQKFDSYSLH